MSEHGIVTAAQAQIVALTELARDIAADRDRWRKRAELAEALLARSKTSLAETFNDPMQDGGAV